VASEDAGGVDPLAYLRVDVRTLDLGTVLGCDLHMASAPNEHALFLPGDAPFTDAQQKELGTTGVSSLYVLGKDSRAYASYLLSRMARSFADSSRAASEQAECGYQGVHFLLGRALQAPGPETVALLHQGVAAVVVLAVARPETVRLMTDLTRADGYAYIHSMNVGVFGMALALCLDFGVARKQRVAQGLFLHDIGMTRLPSEIVYHQGKFSAEDREAMERHPTLGVQVLRDAECIDPIILNIVYQHHERDDASGYPRGLKAGQIALEAKICAIADSFDALSTPRSYRECLSTYDALQVLVDEMRFELNPSVFEAFVKLFAR